LIGKLLGRISAFLARSGRHQAEADLGYVDEESDVSAWQPVPKQRKRDLLRRLIPRAEKWNDMAGNRERVRYLYREWLRRLAREGHASPPHLTPEEIRQQAASTAADADLVRLYYKARYDSTDITDAELKAVARERGKTV
jgi:hypothetical protein